ncbi:hypothetical protein [Ruminococcus albus]
MSFAVAAVAAGAMIVSKKRR